MDGVAAPIGQRHKRHPVAAEAAGVWKHDRQRRLSTHGGVHGVAASPEALKAGRYRDWMGRGDRAVNATSERRASAHER
jgi:hypothetical protein